ncbi:hypothetical protein MRB53_023966 [Persea americana]|uniref:Uncharacterized protein n=1 Tax=Persea americana TaxID=3435 RepID=A0ACC2LC24_PERAE|nr:hypothetical protein MRB53_023966 [Persea americana]
MVTSLASTKHMLGEYGFQGLFLQFMEEPNPSSRPSSASRPSSSSTFFRYFYCRFCRCFRCFCSCYCCRSLP